MEILDYLFCVSAVTKQTDTNIYKDLELLMLDLLRKLYHILKKLVTRIHRFAMTRQYGLTKV